MGDLQRRGRHRSLDRAAPPIHLRRVEGGRRKAVGSVAFVTHEDCLRHDTGYGHPERPARLRAILEAVDQSAVPLTRLTPEPVSDEILYTVHEEAYVTSLRGMAASGGGMLDPDTVVSAGSYDAARLAAGAACAAVEQVWRTEGSAAFAAGRPPGHHALPARGMGFCLFNNVACAAVAARRWGAARIFIVDWDLHHGNGTQDVFYRDGSVLFASVHQEHWYPGTGGIEEVGAGAGEGFTVNVPLPAGTGDEGYRLVFEEIIVPLGRAFRPDVVLVSAGYDAHAADPLGGMLISTAGFGMLTDLVRDAAGPSTGVAAVLEGGYHLKHLSESVLATLSVLGGGPRPTPVASATASATDEVGYAVIAGRVRQVREIARNYWTI